MTARQSRLLANLETRARHWLALAMGWRDWRVPVKLLAVTAVPVVFVVALGIVQIQSEVAQADRFAAADQQVAVNEQVRSALTALQRERDGAAGFIASGRVADPARLRQQAANSDAARAAMNNAVGGAKTIDPTTIAVFGPMQKQLDKLPILRMHLLAGQVDAGIAVARYTEIIGPVLNFERALISGFSEPSLSRAAAALFDVSASEEEIYFQQSLVTAGIGRGELAADEQQGLRDSGVRLSARLNDFRVVADPADQREYDRIVSGPLVGQRTLLEQTAVNAPIGLPGQPAFPVAQHAWTVASDAVTFEMRTVSDGLTARLRGTATTLQNKASSVAGFNAVALFSALLAVAAIAFVIARQLVRSLGLLRHSALEIAQEQLRAEVRTIRDGDDAEIVIAPVPVYSKEEVGEVARAFDEVHLQALRLAAEQTSLRRSYNNVFVNLSRRSQSLVERQLTLFEALERDEQDPAHLSTLFQLDHLATRMRRNNENLMVLSGGDLARRFSQPVPLTDLLRAAVSEIEHYPRVLLRTTTSARVVGHAASDVLRLLAELMDNAANFSPPKNKVTVATYPNPAGSITVDILDRGIGMTEDEAEEANQRLITTPEIDISASRRMGLFVVGRLANRHGITVRLFASQSLEGVRAAITLPASIVAVDRQIPTASGPPPTGDLPSASALDSSRGPVEPATQKWVIGAQREPADNALPSIGQSEDSGRAESGPAQSELSDPASPLEPDPAEESEECDAEWVEPEVDRAEQDARFRIVADLFTLGGIDLPDDATAQDGQPADFTAVAERLHVSPAWSPADAASPADAPATDLFSASGASPAEDRPAADDRFPAVPGRTTTSGTPSSGTPSNRTRSNGTPSHGTPVDTRRISRDQLPTRGAGSDGSARVTETTPIFDALASAWFRESLGQPAQSAQSARPAEPVVGAASAVSATSAAVDSQEWSSAADEGWRAVDQAAQPEPAELTTAGLPRRVRGARLLPGSVAPEAAPPGNPERDPQVLRGRLSSFQRGLHEARHRAFEPLTVRTPFVRPASTQQAELDIDAEVEADVDTTPDSVEADTAIAETAVVDAGELGADSAEDGTPQGDSAADGSAAARAEETEPASSSESAGESADIDGSAESADAESIRPPTAAEWAAAGERAGQWQDMPAADRVRPEQPVAGAASAAFAQLPAWGGSAPEVPEIQEVLTPAGLPRRVPRARLRPGSMPDPEQSGADPERNAEIMRGRLSSFQRGVQLGRRARGSAASTVLERRQEKA